MSFQINGDLPDIVGKKSQSLIVIQQQEDETITDPANTVFFKFSDGWIRLCLDGSTVFWRNSEPPSNPINSKISSCLVMLNLCELDGVIGFVLSDVDYFSDDVKVIVKMKFLSGKTLQFTHYGYEDYTTLDIL